MDGCETLVVGAGPAGLAVGAALRRKHVPFAMLERNEHVGSSWRRHYDRLHLHTPKRLSALPFVAYPRGFPRYPSRDQVVEYLENYARTFDLRPEFGVDVTRCIRTADDRWEVRTSRGIRRARHLVIASGFSRVPHRPSWPGLGDFAGAVLHSSEYTHGQRFRAQRVLVVGFGNSGAEIALDLAECGATARYRSAVRVNVVPRDVLRVPITYLALANRNLPPRVADRLNALTIRLAIGDLREARHPQEERRTDAGNRRIAPHPGRRCRHDRCDTRRQDRPASCDRIVLARRGALRRWTIRAVRRDRARDRLQTGLGAMFDGEACASTKPAIRARRGACARSPLLRLQHRAGRPDPRNRARSDAHRRSHRRPARGVT